MSTIASDSEIQALLRDAEKIIKPSAPRARRATATATAQGNSSTPRPGPAPAPGPAAPNTEPSFAGGNPQALEFDNPLEMLLFYSPDKKPYLWQKRELLRMAGYTAIHKGDLQTRETPTDANPLFYTLVAANGSGKDAYFIAPFAVWFCGAKIRSKCIITSASDEQIKHQTFAYIKAYCERVNAKHGVEIFEIVDKHIRCHRTGSEIRLFVTNTAGRAEGNHPFDDWPGAEMAFICNEAKSIEPALWTGFQRFTGYNYWLEVSSPGERGGHFYDSVCSSDRVNHRLSHYFCTRVTAFDCPHISRAHLEMMRKRHGEKSLFWYTSVLAEFYEGGDQVVIPFTLTRYDQPAPKTYGLPRHAGLDLSLGGDETVLSVWQGNTCVAQECVRIRDANVLRDWVINKLAEHNVEPSNCNADGGGLGKPIIHAIREQGCDIAEIKNDERPLDTRNYRNRGVEMWHHFRRLVETKTLRLPADPTLITQLTSRRFFLTTGKAQLEPKEEIKKRGGQSPDRADAAILAFARIPLSVFLGAEVGETEAERAYRESLKQITLDQNTFAQLERKLRAQRDGEDTARQVGNYSGGAAIGRMHDYYSTTLNYERRN
jgi:hypothetical protein